MEEGPKWILKNAVSSWGRAVNSRQSESPQDKQTGDMRARAVGWTLDLLRRGGGSTGSGQSRRARQGDGGWKDLGEMLEPCLCEQGDRSCPGV